MKTFLTFLLLWGAAAPCQLFGQEPDEQTLLGYYFDALAWTPSVQSPELVAGTTMTQSGVNVTGFSNGVNGSPDMAPYSNQWPTTPQLMNPAKYYEFTVIGAPDRVIKVTRLKIWNRYMNNGPGIFTLRSDAGGNGFSSNLHQVANPSPVSWFSHDINLSLPPIVDGEDVTFRLYAGGGNGIGPWAIDSLKVEGYKLLPLSARVLLAGPLNGPLMDDGLHLGGFIPLTEPYSALGHAPTDNPGATISLTALSNYEDGDAIVDWVLVELRSAVDAGIVVASQALLLQRDGDIVALDGYRRPAFDVPVASYRIAVRHRNHLPVMTADPSAPGILIDFTSTSTATWGTEGQTDMNGLMAMHSGDVDMDGTVKYTGAGNDRDLILVDVGSATPNASSIGYYSTDVSMDGTVKYTGTKNDRDPILVAVGSMTPNSVRTNPLP